MYETINHINTVLNDFIWGVPAMVCIMGVGIYLTIGTKFIQARKFGYAMKNTLGKVFSKSEAKAGSITPFQAVCTALAATVGTGNIAGVAGAIAIGGPGAVFWMWISALLGMCTKFAEVTLAVEYRERNQDGEYAGGPMYYIKNGLGKKWMWLAYLYCIFGAFTVLGTGNATQVNTITASIDSALLNYNIISDGAVPMVNLVIGIIICILVGLILLGGIKRLGQVTEKLVPVMALIYIALGIGLIIINIGKVPAVFGAIFQGAFNPSAVTGGIVGSFLISMRRGVSRGIFSNEAGLGTGSIAHACADTDKPVEQGMFGIFEVFMDTIVICSLTAFTVLCGVESGVAIEWGQSAGTELVAAAFGTVFGGKAGAMIVAVGITLFALSTILSWSLYGTRCFEFLTGGRGVKAYQIIFVIVVIIGATLELELVWDIADTLNGFMAVPNLVALLGLSGVVIQLTKEHFSK